MKKAVIDTDYFKFITKNLTEEGLFIKLMNELEYIPVMHEFVYKQELHEHSFVKKLVKDQIIMVYDFNSLMKDRESENEYNRIFKYAYYELNGRRYSSSMDIKDYHHEKENLGEIHSMILAKFMNYDMFMSNDGGAKFFIKTKINNGKFSIRVVNIEETFVDLLDTNKSSLKWSDIKRVVYQLKHNGNRADEAKYQRIKNTWANE